MSQVQKYGLIADRYALALIEVGQEGDYNFEQISSDLKNVGEILSHSKDLDEFLTNPVISIEDKIEIVEKVFKSEVNPKMVNFLKLIVENGRFQAFSDVCVCFQSRLDKMNNIERVLVTSAVELNDDAKNKLKEKLESKMKKSVSFDWAINPEIIAGLVINMGDNIIDTSLKHKLDDMKKKIAK